MVCVAGQEQLIVPGYCRNNSRIQAQIYGSSAMGTE